jgi:S-DNA-T family DNA segregation ATPase FtsK/SpoIIIE
VRGSTVSRRVSEFVGVALFAVALIWVISLASYDPSDPVWFFSTGSHAPANFAGRVGAFLAELSFQLSGYASYAIPALLVVIGWNFFWCRAVDAAATKTTGAALLLGCLSAFLSLVFGTLEVSGKSFRAGGYSGEWIARVLSDYLNRTGSMIVILTLIFLATILATQFSFGRFFGAISAAVSRGAARAVDSFREWREERRREKQRRDVIAKHTQKNTPDPRAAGTASAAPADVAPQKGPKKRDARAEEPDVPAGTALGSARSFQPPKPPKVSVPSPPLPLQDSELATKAPAERRRGDYTHPPLALLDAPKTERKIDERELMDGARLLEEKCREFSVEGSVVQIHPGPVVTTFEFKPDAGVKYSKITGLADDLCLAMQAESVLIDRIAGKSTVGIQIPNTNREQISLRELLESEAYRR